MSETEATSTPSLVLHPVEPSKSLSSSPKPTTSSNTLAPVNPLMNPLSTSATLANIEDFLHSGRRGRRNAIPEDDEDIDSDEDDEDNNGSTNLTEKCTGKGMKVLSEKIGQIDFTKENQVNNHLDCGNGSNKCNEK